MISTPTIYFCNLKQLISLTLLYPYFTHNDSIFSPTSTKSPKRDQKTFKPIIGEVAMMDKKLKTHVQYEL